MNSHRLFQNVSPSDKIIKRERNPKFAEIMSKYKNPVSEMDTSSDTASNSSKYDSENDSQSAYNYEPFSLENFKASYSIGLKKISDFYDSNFNEDTGVNDSFNEFNNYLCNNC